MITVKTEGFEYKMRPPIRENWVSRCTDFLWHNKWRICQKVFILNFLERLEDLGYEIVKINQTCFIRVKSIRDRRKRFDIIVTYGIGGGSDYYVEISDMKNDCIAATRLISVCKPWNVDLEEMLKEAEEYLA